jgi:hypothetical protein
MVPCAVCSVLAGDMFVIVVRQRHFATAWAARACMISACIPMSCLSSGCVVHLT